MKIHPSAIIHPEAQMADDVEIGPHVLIDGAAVIGAGSVIQANAILSGCVRMGKNNRIGYGAVIGAEPQDLSFRAETKSEVVIGDGNTIRELATIHRGTTEGSATEIGDRNFLMAGAHVAHNAKIGSDVIMANNVLLAGYVEIGNRVFIGGGSAFHQFMRVGTLAMVQGLRGFTKDIPPYTTAVNWNCVSGLNTLGMRRAKFTAEQREDVKKAFKLIYTSGLNLSQALASAREETWTECGRTFLDFVGSAKKRGICALFSKERAGFSETA